MAETPGKDAAATDTHLPKRGRRKLRLPPVGSSPGTLIADPNAQAPLLTLTLIKPGAVETVDNATLDDVRKARGKWPTLWLDCAGLADVKLVQDIGSMFKLHQLSLEDTVNSGTRPKVDVFPDNVFVVMAMIDDAETHRYEQISLYLGADFVITFQERCGDPFGSVRKRLASTGPSRLREKGPDYLAYALIDAIVDSYFPLADRLAEKIEAAEDDMMTRLDKQQARRFHFMRRGAMQLRRPLAPIRETLSALIRTESPFIKPETRIYLSDTLDHATTLIDILDSQRDMLTGLIEMHLSMSQAKTNDIISFLTVVSSIFIPLTFLVGVWGMNFDTKASPWNMPELEAYYGYPVALAFMFVIALAIVAFFRWRKWL